MSYFRRVPSVRFAVAALAVYAALLVVSPVAHTDLADHVKSSTHCQVCASNPLAARIEPRVAASAPTHPALGEVAAFLVPGFVSPIPFRTSGRSPPAWAITFSDAAPRSVPPGPFSEKRCRCAPSIVHSRSC